MKRIYRLNGKIITLKQLLSEIEMMLLYSGNANDFESLGIDFEDIGEENE